MADTWPVHPSRLTGAAILLAIASISACARSTGPAPPATESPPPRAVAPSQSSSGTPTAGIDLCRSVGTSGIVVEVPGKPVIKPISGDDGPSSYASCEVSGSAVEGKIGRTTLVRLYRTRHHGTALVSARARANSGFDRTVSSFRDGTAGDRPPPSITAISLGDRAAVIYESYQVRPDPRKNNLAERASVIIQRGTEIVCVGVDEARWQVDKQVLPPKISARDRAITLARAMLPKL